MHKVAGIKARIRARPRALVPRAHTLPEMGAVAQRRNILQTFALYFTLSLIFVGNYR